MGEGRDTEVKEEVWKVIARESQRVGGVERGA